MTTETKPGLAGGVLAHWRGLDFLMRHPSLLPLIAIPVAINMVLFAVFFWVSFTYFGGWLDGLLPQSEGWYWVVLYYVLWVVFVALLLLTMVFTFTALANVLASPFNDALSEKTEVLATGQGEKPFSFKAVIGEAGRTIIEELKKIFFFLLVFAVLLPLNLIPVAGSVLYAGLMGIFTILWLGLNFMDYSFARKGYRFGRKIKFIRRNLSAVFGYGLGVFILLLVPLVNLALIPIAVIGGTLLYLDLAPMTKDV